jgi:transcription elongation factor Elf1
MLQFSCPHCSVLMRVDEQHRGKKGRCKNCGNDLAVPLKNVEEDDFVSACLTDSFNTEEGNEERRAKAAANTRQLERESRIKVTTGDLSMPYEIIGPVYFSVSNKGVLFNQLRDLISKYRELLSEMTSSGTMTAATLDWSFLYGQFSVGQSQFDSAFFVAVQELKSRAARVGGDAIVHMRQDIDIDTDGMQFFYLQMYGTAVKVKQPRAAGAEQA